MRKIIKAIIIIIVSVMCVRGVFTLAHSALCRAFPLRYAEYIDKYAEEYGHDRYLIMGMIFAESKFDPNAHSGKAKGLMQLTDRTAEEVAEKLGLEFSEDLAYEPEANIRMGCCYLAYLLTIYQSEATAIAAYNAGLGTVGEWLENDAHSSDGEELSYIPYEETDKYVKRVYRLSEIYKKLY